MNDIDDKIREALQAEDAELFAEYGGEQSMLTMVMETFRTRSRWLVLLGIVIGIVFMVLAIVAAARFFQAETVREMLAYSTGFVFCLLAVGGMKVWYWMELNKNAVTREVKRLELQIARLSRAIKSAGKA